jgi:hypothetical protein
MNFFSTHKLISEESKEEFRCIRCGDRPNIVQIMLEAKPFACTNAGAVSAFGMIKTVAWQREA